MNSKSLLYAGLIGLFAVAQHAHGQGFFLDARIGRVDNSDTFGSSGDRAYTFGAGYWFNQNWAIEAGYAALYDLYTGTGDDFRNAELNTFYAGAKTRILFDKGAGRGFFLGGRAGLHAWDAEIANVSRNSTDYYLGAFVGYQFSPNWSASVNYQYFELDWDDANTWSLGVEYTF